MSKLGTILTLAQLGAQDRNNAGGDRYGRNLTRLPWNAEISLLVDLQISLSDRIAELRKEGRR